MHHALHIEEILLHIFGHCYILVDGWSPRRTRCDLAALARTCKAFKEPALDMIWSELDDLTPLVRCLSEEYSWINVSEDGVYSLKTRFEQADWDIILGYARRVRAFPRLSGSSGLNSARIEALSNPPASTVSIFPNLRSIRIYEPSARIARLIRHFANPKVTDISLVGPGILGTSIDAFGEGCPSVTFFHATECTDNDTISSLVCRWQNLTCVLCGDIHFNVDTLHHLSRLRNLSRMAFQVHDAVVAQIHVAQSSISVLTFSALHFLSLSSPFLTTIGRLLRHFRVPLIHYFSACLHARPTAPDLMSFFVALQEACTDHASLDTLSLLVYDKSGTIHLSMEHSPPYYITFDHLRPLTVFTNIHSITLDIPCGMALNERGLLTLASSWPHLEIFQVGKDYDWVTSSGITPEGFLHLMERCRSLRMFHFMFDTHDYTDIPQGHPWRALTMPKHAFIHLLNSPIEDASIEALGVFFHVAPYPDFTLTTNWDDGFFRDNYRPRETCDLYHDRWVKVRELAGGLCAERRCLRRSLEVGYPE